MRQSVPLCTMTSMNSTDRLCMPFGRRINGPRRRGIHSLPVLLAKGTWAWAGSLASFRLEVASAGRTRRNVAAVRCLSWTLREAHQSREAATTPQHNLNRSEDLAGNMEKPPSHLFRHDFCPSSQVRLPLLNLERWHPHLYN